MTTWCLHLRLLPGSMPARCPAGRRGGFVSSSSSRSSSSSSSSLGASACLACHDAHPRSPKWRPPGLGSSLPKKSQMGRAEAPPAKCTHAGGIGLALLQHLTLAQEEQPPVTAQTGRRERAHGRQGLGDILHKHYPPHRHLSSRVKSNQHAPRQRVRLRSQDGFSAEQQPPQ